MSLRTNRVCSANVPCWVVKGYYHEGHSLEILSQREGRTVEAIYKTIQRARRRKIGVT